MAESVTKTRNTTDTGTVRELYWEPSYTTSYKTMQETLTSDSPFPPGDSYFKVEKWWCDGSRSNGGPDHRGHYTYQNDASPFLKFQLLPDILGPDDEPNVNEMATKLLADTNPNQPVVDLPIFVRELPDIPRLLRTEGNEIIRAFRERNFTKLGGSANLGVQFGLAPTIGDLVKLITFQKQVKRRVDVLKKLRDHGSMSFKRTLYKGANANETYPYGCYVWQGHTVRIWGHVKWFPDTDLPSTDEGLLRMAERAIVGLNGVDIATLWEAMPWSWLIDWCVDVGSFLETKRNAIPLRASTPIIMRERKMQAQHPRFESSPGYFWEKGTLTHRIRERIPKDGVVPQANLSFLNLGQVSILASIGVTRRFGGRH